MDNAKKLPVVHGAGGGGKGGGAGYVAHEDPNTLRSVATGRVVDLLCEGPIVGLVDGLKSVYLNQTPIQGPSGNYNFRGLQLDFRYGYPDQDYIPGFPDVETTVDVNVVVTYNGGPITREVNDPTANAVLVIISVPQLTWQDTSTGDLHGNNVTFTITAQSTVSGKQVAVNDNIDGKVVSTYEKAYRLNLPDTGPWTITVTRTKPDATASNQQDAFSWTGYTIITDGKLRYPDSVVVGLTADSIYFGNSMPSRAYLVDGKIIKVPNPPASGGIWDGSFKLDYSNNPVWVLLDLLTDTRYGLGIPLSQIDTGTFYNIAQYCDEMVADAYGGTEKRYTFNGVLQTQEDAFTVLQAVVASFRGMVFWSSGSVTIRADMPADPVKLVTPANVINGMFTYMGTALKTRHSTALITWNDPLDFYRPAVEVVETTSLLQEIGYNPANISLIGCTSRGQAHRQGLWMLDSEANETQTVTYRASFDHADVLPGDIISVADPHYAGVRRGGRVVNATTTSVDLDDSVTLSTGETYTLLLTGDDGTLYSCAVTDGAGTYTTLHFTYNGGALAAAPSAGAVWVLSGTDTAPRTFRVISVREVDELTVEIVALIHDPTKYARIEQGVTLNQPTYVQIPDASPITSMVFTEESVTVNSLPIRSLTVSWPVPVSNNSLNITTSYEVQYYKDNGQWTLPAAVTQPQFVISDVQPGTYTVSVVAVNSFGRRSAAYSAGFQVVFSGDSPLLAPVNLVAVDSGSTTFTSPDLNVTWENAPNNIATHGVVSSYQVTVKDPATLTILTTVTTTDTRFAYTFGDNLRDGGPRRSLMVSVNAVDAWGRLTPATTQTFINPAPAVPNNVTFTAGFDSLLVSFARPTEPDWAGVLIYMSQTSGFTPNSATQVYDGPDTSFVQRVVPGQTWYMVLAAYDQFGKTGLNYSSQFTGTTILIDHAALASGIIDSSNLVSDLNTQINNNTTSIQTLQTTTNNLSAEYTVKIDNNGHVAGFGLASTTNNGATVSDFIVSADKFAIASPSVGGATPVIPFIIDASSTPPVLSFQGNMSVSNLTTGTLAAAVISVGASNFTIDGSAQLMRVNDGTRDRVKIGLLSTGNYGIEIVDANGNTVLSNDGRLGSTLYIGTGTQTLGQLATNAATPAISYIGEFATAPSTMSYGVNSVYKNTTDNNSYILTNGAWSLYLPCGAPGANGAAGPAGQRGSQTFYVSGQTAWSDAAATTAASANGGPVMNDTVVEYGTGFSQTRYWNGTSWVQVGVVLDGTLLVTGSVAAAAISTPTLSAISANVGTLTAGTLQSSGGNFVIDLGTGTIKVYDANNVLRVELGAF